jgi:hypothetical protein
MKYYATVQIEEQMTCKHRWEPIWSHKLRDYCYHCSRCGRIICTPKKEQKK